MDMLFYIVLRCRTGEGFENFARFDLGTDRAFAYQVFSELEGTTDTTEMDTLTMELVETKTELPLNLKIISCTLDQLAVNCRFLAKEIFRQINL